MKSNKPTVVIGASSNEERYSNKAISLLLAYNHTVFAIGKKEEIIHGIESTNVLLPLKNVDTVTMYVSAVLQKNYYDYILSLQPKRVIFNPGTENEELFKLLQDNNIAAVEACTLVMLKTNQY